MTYAKGLIVGVATMVWLTALHGQAPTAPPQEVKPTTEVHKLKVENLQMKQALLGQQVQDLQKQVTEAGKALDEQWAALEKELRETLKPDASWIWDRQKGAFTPKPEPKKETP